MDYEYDDDDVAYDDDDDDDDDVDDLVGHDDDDDDDDILGLRIPWRRGRKRRGGRKGKRPRRGRRPRLLVRPRGVRAVLAKPPLVSTTPGVPAASKLYIPLGLGSFTFLVAPGATVNAFATNPQKPVRPRRLWIDVVRTGAAGTQVEVTNIRIGTKSMLAGTGAIPAAQFAPGAFARAYNMFDSAQPGIDITVDVAMAGALILGGDSVTVTVSLDCESLG